MNQRRAALGQRAGLAVYRQLVAAVQTVQKLEMAMNVSHGHLAQPIAAVDKALAQSAQIPRRIGGFDIVIHKPLRQKIDISERNHYIILAARVLY